MRRIPKPPQSEEERLDRIATEQLNDRLEDEDTFLHSLETRAGCYPYPYNIAYLGEPGGRVHS